MSVETKTSFEGLDASEPLLDLTRVAFALSDALDLVGVNVVQHGKRVAFAVIECARTLGLTPEERDDAFLAALLHDCGVSSSRVHWQLMSKLDWEGSPEHCVAGCELLRDFEPFQRHAALVLRHHTHWSDPLRESLDPAVALLSNLIHLADRADALRHQAGRRDVLVVREEVRRSILGLRGVFFSPDLVDAFLATSEPEAFWLTTETHHLERYMQDAVAQSAPRPATVAALRQLAGIFARIVDGKSRFTAEHSLGVARLARHLATSAGLSEPVCDRVEIAALLHDLGKLRVRDEILDKAAPLDTVEFAAMMHHTFETYQILRRVEPLGEMATWAAYHHERLTGRGYPFHRQAGDIPLPARLIAVADVFQALAQDRPYRASLDPPRVLRILREMADAGHLDAGVVGMVARDLDACHAAAVGCEAS
jgi:HD-GYP domain-containing protein (c-di-GMP phosphodiesterase class II)